MLSRGTCPGRTLGLMDVMRHTPRLVVASLMVGLSVGTGTAPSAVAAGGITVSATSIVQDTLRDPVLSGRAPAGARATLQVIVRGRWAANRRFTVPVTGTYRVPLHYGHASVGTYTYRLVTAEAVSPTITLRRTAVLAARSRVTTRADVLSTWRPGCPVHFSRLRTVELNHWGFDGRMRRGTLVLSAAVEKSALQAFQVGIDARFPIAQMREVSAYGGDDARSMAANNTSAFNCRKITNGSRWSTHSSGRAIDINPVQNPYIYRGTVSPPAGRAYTDRRRVRPGMMVASAPLTRAFLARGWRWLSTYDYQHVEK